MGTKWFDCVPPTCATLKMYQILNVWAFLSSENSFLKTFWQVFENVILL